MPLWNCPKIIGRANTVQLAPKTDAALTVTLINSVIEKVTSDDRVLVIVGVINGISSWGIFSLTQPRTYSHASATKRRRSSI